MLGGRLLGKKHHKKFPLGTCVGRGKNYLPNWNVHHAAEGGPILWRRTSPYSTTLALLRSCLGTKRYRIYSELCASGTGYNDIIRRVTSLRPELIWHLQSRAVQSQSNAIWRDLPAVHNKVAYPGDKGQVTPTTLLLNWFATESSHVWSTSASWSSISFNHTVAYVITIH